MPSQRPSSNGTIDVPERASRTRQRQRLIDACISALHLYGPSRTTVEKVVALADLSPGIVRFYFDSKDAMLVASLAHLAAEFEELVLTPVARLKETPVRALERLVELYLDAEIASPRKVSVWYCFWGEASSRQEYLEICGRKDDDFGALVCELIERVIRQSGATHLDADAVALGLIGVLEMLWQGIAFTPEAQIDRAAARQRSLAYLRSVFPGQFGEATPRQAVSRLPSWAYADGTLLALERERLLKPSWQLAAHASEIAHPGDFLTLELPGERVLLVKQTEGGVRAFRNTCRKRPHALVAEEHGRFDGRIRCDIHGLEYGLDGKLLSGGTPGDLVALEVTMAGQRILVCAASGAPAELPAEWATLRAPAPVRTRELEVAADWKLLIEQWLESAPSAKNAQRVFLAPNHIADERPDGLLLLQVIPVAAGRCRLRCLEYGKSLREKRSGRGKQHDSPGWLRQDIEVAESTQAGLASGAADPPETRDPPPDLAAFRRSVAALLPALGARRS